MATEVTVPRLGEDMESGVLIRWLVDDGARVESGDALYELDTDKVTQEVEAEADGVLRIVAEPGRRPGRLTGRTERAQAPFAAVPFHRRASNTTTLLNREPSIWKA